jgi:ATP-dependent Clp protease ATP-binding subunit ClpA
MFERLSREVRGLLARAQDEARRFDHDSIGTEHLLLGLVAQGKGMAADVLFAAGVTEEKVRAEFAHGVDSTRLSDTEALRAIGIDLDAVTGALTEAFGEDAVQDAARRARGSDLRFRPEANEVLKSAIREAATRHHRSLDTEHVLLGLVAEGDSGAAVILEKLAPTVDFRALVLAELQRRDRPSA